MKILESNRHKTGLFFGSFNPVHIGHMALANYFLDFTPIDDLQLILSPQNPLKANNELVSEQHRLKMLEIALEAYPELPISVNTIEFDLPKPSYTIDTLAELQKQNPNITYLVLMGADNLAYIERWKDYKKLLSEYEVCVYPRMGYDMHELTERYGVLSVGAPIIEVSATFIRAAIGNGYNFSTYLPLGVWDYIKKYKLYYKSDKEQ
ncbi:MAG: nicotinate-nucleotide adenylyltransferase [Prevotellaceae bacterium]|jgi:nicotinate-nucleotide adenylyltransferase|nr:nicotinate-nucleotide adenylyltransferase [Prevotellaceae bacterium]